MLKKLPPTICALAICLLVTSTVVAYVNVYTPSPSPAMSLLVTGDNCGSMWTWSAKDPHWIIPLWKDNKPQPKYFWDAQSQTSITITNYIAIDSLGGTSQAQANSRIDKAQLWVWLDSNGDGKADIQDATTYPYTAKWTLLWQGDPNGDNPKVPDVNATFWQATQASPTAPVISCADSSTNMLNGTSGFTLQAGHAYLILKRVIDSSGNSNLMASVGAVEQWDDGDTSNKIGSNIPTDKYATCYGLGGRLGTNLMEVYIP